MGESKMTKVYVTQSILDYQQEMADLVRQTIKEKFIAGVKAARRGEPLFFQVDLLPHPSLRGSTSSSMKGTTMTSSKSLPPMILGSRTSM
jgi:hypothetical protein